MIKIKKKNVKWAAFASHCVQCRHIHSVWAGHLLPKLSDALSFHFLFTSSTENSKKAQTHLC